MTDAEIFASLSEYELESSGAGGFFAPAFSCASRLYLHTICDINVSGSSPITTVTSLNRSLEEDKIVSSDNITMKRI